MWRTVDHRTTGKCDTGAESSPNDPYIIYETKKDQKVESVGIDKKSDASHAGRW